MKGKDGTLSGETKGALELLMAEILNCKTKEETDTLIKSWAKANKLHPERVRIYTIATL